MSCILAKVIGRLEPSGTTFVRTNRRVSALLKLRTVIVHLKFLYELEFTRTRQRFIFSSFVLRLCIFSIFSLNAGRCET